MFGLGTTELLILAVIGLLLFGRRLPEVGKNLGKGIVEFKKGLKSVEDEVEEQSSRPSSYKQTSATARVEPQPALNAPVPGVTVTSPTEARVSRADVVE